MEIPSTRRQRGRFIACFRLVVVIFLWGHSVEGNAAEESLPLCDFRVEVASPDFCMIQGRVHDIDLSIIPIAGSCEESAVLSILGLPAGVTQQLILPHRTGPKETKVATVRIDTANVPLTKKTAYPLTVSATQNGITRADAANMILDLPSFDFSIKPDASELLIYQEETASLDLAVELLGSACIDAPPVRLSLHSSSSPLSFTVSSRFSSDFVVPPGKTTVSFKASSGPEIGSFVATVAGCCASSEAERTGEMILQILPNLPALRLEADGTPPEAQILDPPPFEALIEKQGEVKIDTMDNILNDLQFSPTVQEETRKGIEAEANRGYINASEEEVQILQQSKARKIGPGTLTFEPSSLQGTPFEKFSLKGAYPTGKYLGKWTAIVRLFAMPDGILVELTEDDIVSSGGSENVIAKEGVDFYLHGFPATVIVQQSESGAALSRVSWKTATKSYSMRMEGNVKTNGKKKLFLDLAQSLPD